MLIRDVREKTDLISFCKGSYDENPHFVLQIYENMQKYKQAKEVRVEEEFHSWRISAYGLVCSTELTIRFG